MADLTGYTLTELREAAQQLHQLRAALQSYAADLRSQAGMFEAAPHGSAGAGMAVTLLDVAGELERLVR